MRPLPDAVSDDDFICRLLRKISWRLFRTNSMVTVLNHSSTNLGASSLIWREFSVAGNRVSWDMCGRGSLTCYWVCRPFDSGTNSSYTFHSRACHLTHPYIGARCLYIRRNRPRGLRTRRTETRPDTKDSQAPEYYNCGSRACDRLWWLT
jgi:hypothetical protein